MFISPIQPMSGLEELSAVKPVSGQSAAEIPFKGVFQDALQNVMETDKVSSENLEKLATGQSDDLHNNTIASTKAQMSMQALVTLRNKALDAYSEIMRINL